MALQFKHFIEYSINILGWGLVSDIAIFSEKLRFIGQSRYDIASLYYILKSKVRECTLILDNKKYYDQYLFILVHNTIHTGKGMKAAPEAILNDGLIDVIILKSSISKIELLFLLPKIFSGKHILSKKVEYRKVKNLSIIPEKNEKLNIDGEMKHQTPLSIKVLPEQIKVLM